MNTRKRVLISAYAISPVLGSEWKSGWEIANHISKFYDVTVIYGNSDGIHGQTTTFDKYSAEHHLPYCAIKVEPNRLHLFLHKLTSRFYLSGIILPTLLHAWNKRAYLIAKRLHEERPFDVVHQLGPIGFRNPGYLWKLNCHSYWGPIGGALYINLALIKSKFSFYYLEALYRNINTRLQVYNPYVANAAKNYTKVSFATVDSLNYFQRHFKRSGPIISDQGTANNCVKFDKSHFCIDDKLNVAWVGSLTPRKNVDLLLDIIINSPKNVQFNIYGSGPYSSILNSFVKSYPNATYHGQTNRDVLKKALRASHVILSTSHSEGNPAGMFEAIEGMCIPVVPARNGFLSTLNEKVSFYLDNDSYEKSIQDAVSAFEKLFNKSIRDTMLNNMQVHMNTFTWNALSERHMSQYD